MATGVAFDRARGLFVVEGGYAYGGDRTGRAGPDFAGGRPLAAERFERVAPERAGQQAAAIPKAMAASAPP